MLDERKVKLMTQLALYDQTQGKEDFKISEYYRKDYAGVHILYTVLWVTIGYIAVWAIAMIAGLDSNGQFICNTGENAGFVFQILNCGG